jgi:hypothetical protein
MFQPRKAIISLTSEHSKGYKIAKAWNDLIFTNYIACFPCSLRCKVKLVPSKWKPDEAICQPGLRGNHVPRCSATCRKLCSIFSFPKDVYRSELRPIEPSCDLSTALIIGEIPGSNLGFQNRPTTLTVFFILPQALRENSGILLHDRNIECI